MTHIPVVSFDIMVVSFDKGDGVGQWVVSLDEIVRFNDGDNVGEKVSFVVGDTVGAKVSLVVGDWVGEEVGVDVVGEWLGERDGVMVRMVGESEGLKVVGGVGENVGRKEMIGSSDLFTIMVVVTG
jgi:hypothetical protein